MARFMASSRIVKSGRFRWLSEAANLLRQPVRLASLVDMDRRVTERCQEHWPAASKVRNLAAPDFGTIKRCYRLLDRKRRFGCYSPDRHHDACTLSRVWRL